MEIKKQCSCGIVYSALPATAEYFPRYETYHWHCTCHSTLQYTPDRARTRELIRAEFANAQGK